MRSDELVLGIDGGATKTVAWLATCSAYTQQAAEVVGTCHVPSTAGGQQAVSREQPSVVGRGTAGPANPQTVGFAKALENLNRAITAAFDEASTEPGPVAAAVLALAGSDRHENRQVLERWAEDRRLAHRFRVVNDALPVLIAGSPQGWGVALISGTGSFAFGQTPDGRSTRAGGWGYLFGDEGSGYAIALAGLRAVAKSADGRGPATQLSQALLGRLELKTPEELIAAIYRIAVGPHGRVVPAAFASLAQIVTKVADQGDPVAEQILSEAADELAAMVVAVAQKLGFSDGMFPLALAGGVLLGSNKLQSRLEARLNALALRPDWIAVVADPVMGAVKLAQAVASGQW